MLKPKTFLSATVGAITMFFAFSLSSNPVYADNTITMSISDSNLVLDLLPKKANGDFVTSNNINIGVSLTGPGGYTLGIKANNTGANATKLINTTDSTKYFTSITGAVSASSFAEDSATAANNYNNKWGYLPSKFNSVVNTDYRSAPNSNGDILDSTSGTNDTGSYTVSIGARANLNTATGSYSNTFVIIAVANFSCNPNATNINEVLCMQDFNNANRDAIINSMGDGNNHQYRVYDNRDWKQYYIAKMKDGKVWMTQNLDLDLETSPTNVSALTSDNTDLTAFGSQNYTTDNGYSCSNAQTDCSGGVITWTPATATSTVASSWSTSTTEPRSFDYGDRYYWISTTGSGTGYNSTSTCVEAHDAKSCSHYHLGNYYNFTAAVASNSTSNLTSNYTSMGNSICPAGWKLPAGRTSSSASDVGYYTEANYALKLEGIVLNYVTGGIGATWNTSGWVKIRNNPFYMVTSGYKSGTSNPSSTNSQIRLWTGTINSSSNAYNIYALSSNSYPSASYSRSNGIAVRCVLAPSSNTGSTVITFNKNASDATNTMSNQTISAGNFTALTTNNFTRPNYTFTNWCTNEVADGSVCTVARYSDGQKYYAAVGSETNNVTLYAQWARNLTITFDKNAADATGTMGTQTINGNSSAALDANQFSRSGYLFGGWSTSPNGDKEYDDGANYTVSATNTTGSIILYAKWNGQRTVTFKTADANATGIYFDGTFYTNNQTTTAYENNTYRIAGDYTAKHGFSSWAATSGSFENNSYPSTYFTLGSSDVTITLTSQEATVSISSFTSSSTTPSCLSAITPILVYDPRDNEAYYIAKLCDGKWWMLDNLRLDLTNSTIINNLSPSNTNASATALNYLKNGGGTASDKYAMTGLSGSNWTSSNSFSAPLVNVSGTVSDNSNYANTWSGPYTRNSVAPVTFGAGSGKIGAYYNFCAVSAGTYCYGNGTSSTNSPTSDPNTSIQPTAYDIEGDICPAGWRIPTGDDYNSTTGGGDYHNLYTKYSNNNQNAFLKALSLLYSGDISNNNMVLYGSGYIIWTSTWYSDNSFYHIDYSYWQSSMIGIKDYYSNRSTIGAPVRCVYAGS